MPLALSAFLMLLIAAKILRKSRAMFVPLKIVIVPPQFLQELLLWLHIEQSYH
jgi:hypothetical protein